MRFSKVALIAAMAVVLSTASASGTQPDPPGWTAIPRFGLQLTIADQIRLGEKFRIRVSAGGRAVRDAVGEVHISIPPGIEVVEGETVRQIHPNPAQSPLKIVPPDYEWDLYLRPTRIERYLIVGWIRIYRETPQRWDESESILEFDVRADTVIVSRYGHPIRHERVVDGQRFRYGGQHMVLIDGPEPWLADMPGPRKDPEVTEHPPGVCKSCGLTEPKVLRYIVTVGTDGTVRWIEPRPESALPEDPRVLAAAEDALKCWRFRPARLGDRVIANWTAVDVTVLPGAK